MRMVCMQRHAVTYEYAITHMSSIFMCFILAGDTRISKTVSSSKLSCQALKYPNKDVTLVDQLSKEYEGMFLLLYLSYLGWIPVV